MGWGWLGWVAMRLGLLGLARGLGWVAMRLRLLAGLAGLARGLLGGWLAR